MFLGLLTKNDCIGCVCYSWQKAAFLTGMKSERVSIGELKGS